mmetsp:Transcript_55862/g.161793  ORF Transcript_55862/g.161793 Transcript_55862/m.161793 type:complete len:315 (-) Transcript_55862:7-951(-)
MTSAATSASNTRWFVRQQMSLQPLWAALTCMLFKCLAADGSTVDTRAKLKMQYCTCSPAMAAASTATSRRAEPKNKWPCKYNNRTRWPSRFKTWISQNGRFVRLTTISPFTTLITGDVLALCTKNKPLLRTMPMKIAFAGDEKTEVITQDKVMMYWPEMPKCPLKYAGGSDLYDMMAVRRKWKAVFMNRPLKYHFGMKWPKGKPEANVPSTNAATARTATRCVPPSSRSWMLVKVWKVTVPQVNPSSRELTPTVVSSRSKSRASVGAGSPGGPCGNRSDTVSAPVAVQRTAIITMAGMSDNELRTPPTCTSFKE